MNKLATLTIGILMIFTGSCGNHSSCVKTKELRININGEPHTLDPRKGGDVISSSLHFMLFEGLTSLNPDSTTSFAQAESIDISSDSLVYTFHLRDSLWSDGSPVTAQDFEKSWKDILNPAFPAVNAHLLYPIKNAESAKKGLVPLDQVGIRAKDAKTLVVTLEYPTPYFLQLTSFCVFFPVNSKIDQSFPDWANHVNKNFVSNGPYILKTWKHNDEIVLEKNENYWAKEEVKLNAIRISMVSDEMTALQMYENGELDMIGAPLSPIPVDAFAEFIKKGALQVSPVAGTTICAFNNHQFPFNNENIRKAFSLAINREAIVKNITQLGEVIATGPIPPVLKNNKNRKFFKDNDKKRAQELFQKGLDELNSQPSDLEITYYYSTSEANHKIAQALQQQWFEVLGIKIKIENLEHKVLSDKLVKRDYGIAQTYWLAQYSDQMNILERYKFKTNPKNYAGWENEEFIQLLNASALHQNPADRMQTLEEAESLFVDLMPVAPIFHSNHAYLLKPYVKGFTLTPIGNIYYTKLYLQSNE
jgi:oligopeptide transport system substrate-binding protein